MYVYVWVCNATVLFYNFCGAYTHTKSIIKIEMNGWMNEWFLRAILTYTQTKKKGVYFLFFLLAFDVYASNKNGTLLKWFEFESLAFFKSSAFFSRERAVKVWIPDIQLCAVSDKIQAYGFVFIIITAYSQP